MVTVNPGLRGETPRVETLMANKRNPKRGALSYHRFSRKLRLHGKTAVRLFVACQGRYPNRLGKNRRESLISVSPDYSATNGILSVELAGNAPPQPLC